jgi:hypothetical protein
MKKEKLIDLDLGSNGGRVALYSGAEIDEWINKELEFWRWLNGYAGRDNNFQNLYNRTWAPIANLANIVTALRQSEWKDTGLLGHLSQTILSTYQGRDVIHSTTSKALFVEELRKSDGLAAAYALATLVEHPMQPGEAAGYRGIFEALLFDKGIKGSAKPEKKALEDALTSFQIDVTKKCEEADKLNNSLDESLTQFTESTLANRDEFAKLVLASQESIDSMLSTTKIEIDNLTKTYDEKLALQAPVRYWMTKRRFHSLARKKIGGVLRWGGVGSAIFISLALWLLLGDATTTKPPEYWRIGFVVILLTVVFWSVRLGIKILLSHLHLEEDAAQRITMIQTYLSLMRRGQTTSAEDIKQILSALFRPTGDGLVKDEGMPTSLIDFLTRPSK